MAMRCEQWEDAIAWGEMGLKVKPENPASLSQLINIMREMGLRAPDDKVKNHYFKQARDISRHLRMVSAQHFKDAVDMIYTFNAQLDYESKPATAPQLSVPTKEIENESKR